MFITTKLRILRLKYGISLDELAEMGGVSNQQFSRLELGVARGTERKEQLAETALRGVIAARRAALAELEREYLAYRGRLLAPTEVNGDEL